MSGFGGPDFAVLKPVKYQRGNDPWRESNSDFERVESLCFEGFLHTKILPRYGTGVTLTDEY